MRSFGLIQASCHQLPDGFCDMASALCNFSLFTLGDTGSKYLPLFHGIKILRVLCKSMYFLWFVTLRLSTGYCRCQRERSSVFSSLFRDKAALVVAESVLCISLYSKDHRIQSAGSDLEGQGLLVLWALIDPS